MSGVFFNDHESYSFVQYSLLDRCWARSIIEPPRVFSVALKVGNRSVVMARAKIEKMGRWKYSIWDYMRVVWSGVYVAGKQASLSIYVYMFDLIDYFYHINHIKIFFIDFCFWAFYNGLYKTLNMLWTCSPLGAYVRMTSRSRLLRPLTWSISTSLGHESVR